MRTLIVVSLLLTGAGRELAGAGAPNEQCDPGQRQDWRSGLRAHGIFLGRDKVEGVYLSDHTLDMMVKVLNQSDNLIEFRIPPSVKPGKLQLVIKTTGKDAYLLEQPFYVTVRGAKETGEVAASSK